MKICPICGKENRDDTAVCPCGFNFLGTNHIPGKNEEETKHIIRRKKEKNRKGLYISIASVLVFAMLITVAGVLTYRATRVVWHKDIDPVVFVSGDKLMLSDISKPAAASISLAEFDGTEENFVLYQKSFISQNRRTLVFCNNFKETDAYYTVTFDIYSFDLSKVGEDGNTPVLVAQDVTDFTVNDSFDTLVYEKNIGGAVSLYKSSFSQTEELICSDFQSYSVSKDSKRIFYTEKDGRLMLKDGSEPVRLINEKAEIVSAKQDFSEFVYKTENGEFIKENADGKTEVLFGEKDGDISEKDLPVFSRTFTFSEVLSEDGKPERNKVNIIAEGKKVSVKLPEEFFDGEAFVTVTDKNSFLFCNYEKGLCFVHKDGLTRKSKISAESYCVPDYPTAVINVTNYDFSVLG